MRKQVIVPDSLSEITLGQYQKFLKIQEENEDEKFLAVKMVEIFCGIKGDLVMKMKASSIRDITCLLYTSPSPRDKRQSRMPSSA